MFTGRRWRWAGLGAGPRQEAPAEGAGPDRPGRLVPILLALYLTPVLLIVLVVGGVGMLVLAAAHAIASVGRRPEAWPRSPIGPGSSAP